MGLRFCYSVFGRRRKMGKECPNLGCQTISSGPRKVDVESRVSIAQEDTALLKSMGDSQLVDAISKGEEGSRYAMPEFLAECDSLLKEQLSFGRVDTAYKKNDGADDVVDVEKLSLYEEFHQLPYLDHAQSACECPVSSCSQGTPQGEVSLSVGDGTISSDGRRPLVLHKEVALTGGSLGAHEDAYSDYSFGGCSLHPQGGDDGDSAGRVGIPQEFSFGALPLDGGVALGLKSVNVMGGEDCVDNAHLIAVQVCDGEARHSRHASDPGFYAREAQEMSPSTCFEGSASPQPDAVNECMAFHCTDAEKLSIEASDERVGSAFQVADLIQDAAHFDEGSSRFSRVKEWVNSIQLSEVDFDNEDPDESGGGNMSLDIIHTETSETFSELPIVLTGGSNVVTLANAVVRSLHPLSTVAHLSGISLREVPSLGMFSSLRSLNLSANVIAHIPVGFLPRSLHSLDLSRNRIAQIEGFRELSRLRVLNLSYNRISRIGHGLANCTLIKELSLVGNKIGEVEGLHRLLKLAVLDLSFNKVTTPKALGQLAANYGSLLALNLIGNPILTNFSEDQMRKLVTALVPHVAYLNRQPIKAISVREAALDNIARVALGTPQRHAKTRDAKAGRKASGAFTSTAKKKLPPHQHARTSEKKVASAFPSGQHHNHGKRNGKAGVNRTSLLGGTHKIAVDTGKQSMPRSHSAGVLQE